MYETILSYWESLQATLWFTPVSISLMLLLLFILFRISIKLINRTYKKQLAHIHAIKDDVFKGFKIGTYEIFNSSIQKKLLVTFYKAIRIVAYIVVTSVTLSLLFLVHPESKELLILFLHKIATPVQSVAMAIINYIPKLITIVAIIYFIRILIKGVNYIADEIYYKRLKIKKFYPEWAKPTAATINIMLYILALIIIAPYLPGSGSDAFKGISVMAGILISLGSSSSVGNAISGLILTYMRSFKIGDHVVINGIEGAVMEKSLLVTRLKTRKNERITIPNSSILSNPITNQSYSAEKYNLVIYTSVTIGYDVDWRVVHKLLIDSAKSVSDVLENPAPFVLQTALNDFYVEYQLNAYINSPASIPKIKSEIHQNIQDRFREKEIEILSPHYRMMRRDSLHDVVEEVSSESSEPEKA